jgi:hypothetical protein
MSDPKLISKIYNRAQRIRDQKGSSSQSFEPSRALIYGIVFSRGGSIYSPRGTDYVWVMLWGVPVPIQAFKPPWIGVWEGAGVLIARSPAEPDEYEIIRTRTSPYPRTILQDTDYGRAGFGPHGANHQYPTEQTVGPDPVLIWTPAIQNLKSVATGTDLTVTVGPLYYGVGATRAYFPSETIDLTPYLPAAGYALRALVYLATGTNALGVATGASMIDPFDAAWPVFPDTPAGGIASAYFTLRDGITTLSMATDYVDARRFLTETGSSGISSLVPTRAGQMIFANSGLQWTIGAIVVSGGNVVTSGGDVVWSEEI